VHVLQVIDTGAVLLESACSTDRVHEALATTLQLVPGCQYFRWAVDLSLFLAHVGFDCLCPSMPSVRCGLHTLALHLPVRTLSCFSPAARGCKQHVKLCRRYIAK
jgi:hypothetical protein